MAVGGHKVWPTRRLSCESEIGITPFDCPRDNRAQRISPPRSHRDRVPPTAPLRFPLHRQQPWSSDSLLLMAADPAPCCLQLAASAPDLLAIVVSAHRYLTKPAWSVSCTVLFRSARP